MSKRKKDDGFQASASNSGASNQWEDFDDFEDFEDDTASDDDDLDSDSDDDDDDDDFLGMDYDSGRPAQRPRRFESDR